MYLFSLAIGTLQSPLASSPCFLSQKLARWKQEEEAQQIDLSNRKFAEHVLFIFHGHENTGEGGLLLP